MPRGRRFNSRKNISHEKYSLESEMCSERDSPLKRLYRWTHVKLARLAGSGQPVWAAGCELSLALVHARRPAWPGETFETILRVAPPRKMRLPDHTRVNWPVDASASGSVQVGATDEPREFRLAGSRHDKRLERAIPLTTHLCWNLFPHFDISLSFKELVFVMVSK